jgi:hypothetical protein
MCHREMPAMQIEHARRLIGLQLENASSVLQAGYGVDRLRGMFGDMLALLSDVPELRPHFLSLLASTLEARDPSGSGTGQVPREFTELAAHRLRWPEFADLANKRIAGIFHGDRSLAISDVASSILNALSDDWPDIVFYEPAAH